MRIAWEKSGNHGGRVWRCSDWYKFGGEPCLTSLPIPGDERLTIATIAEDMARESFSDSADQGKKQAGFRRIAGGLNKLKEGRQYLSDSEHETLKAAAELLERLGTAAEKAKRYKKKLEEEEKRRIDQRHREAMGLMKEAFNTTDLVAQAVTVLSLADLDHAPTPLHKSDVERVFNDPRTGPIRTAIGNLVAREYDDVLRSIVSGIAYRHSPVVELVAEVKRKHAEHRDQIRSLNRPLLDEIERVIRIDESDNVARLKR